MTNRDEREYWNGEHWLTVWPKRERITDAITPFLFDGLGLRKGDRVLDVGSGGGKTALAAARAVGADGMVVGADISEPLTRLAQERAREAGAGNVTFRVVDVQNQPIDGAPFDVAISQFGVMFFDEPLKAFANIRAQLKPTGRMRFACWQSDKKNPWLFRTRIAEFLPPPVAPEPGKSPTGPFSLADPAATARMLERDSLVDDVQLLAAGVPPGRLAEARAAVDAHMAQFGEPSGLSRFPLAFQLFEASSGGAL
jgi:SAM-dependent methyltransferase